MQMKCTSLLNLLLLFFISSGCTIVRNNRINKKLQRSENNRAVEIPKYHLEHFDNMPNLLFNNRNNPLQDQSRFNLNGRLEIAGEYVRYYQNEDMKYLICLKDSVRYITNNDYKYRNILSRVLPKSLKVKSGDTYRYLAKAKFNLYNRHSVYDLGQSVGPSSELYEYLNDLNTLKDSVGFREKLLSELITLGDTLYNSTFVGGLISTSTRYSESFTAYQIAYENDSIWILDQDIDDLYRHDLYKVHNKDIVIEIDTNDRAWKRALKHLKNHTSFVHSEVLQMNDTVIMIQHYPSALEKKYQWASESSIMTERITTRKNGKKINTVKVTFLGDKFNKYFMEISHKYIKFNIIEKSYENLRDNHMKHESSNSKWY